MRMKKKPKKWIMFLDTYNELPKDFEKNVKYMIKYEDESKIHTMNHIFYKPVHNSIIGVCEFDT